jgi:hypothetical protein
MPIVSCSQKTCWKGCPFYDECYGKMFPICLHWAALTRGDKGVPFSQLLPQLETLPFGVAWRWGDVGDLPGTDGSIATIQVQQLVAVNKRGSRRGFAYSHKPTLGSSRQAGHNREMIAMMNAEGFCVNLSGEGLAKADVLLHLGIAPVVTVVPKHGTDPNWRTMRTPDGVRVMRCPAEWQERPSGCSMQCTRCGGTAGPLCSTSRDFVVGFTAHAKVAKTEAVIARMEKEYGRAQG